MNHSARKAVLELIIVASLVGCGTNDRTDNGERVGREGGSHDGTPIVYVVNYPLKYFAERIAGDQVEVVFPAIEGDPASWEPDPSQVAEYQNADLILLNGAGYAKWIGRASLRTSRMVNTASGLDERFIRQKDVVTHTHGLGGEHTHGDIAFTTWLDPTMATAQARVIEQAFSRTWPEKAVKFRQGLAGLENDLQILDSELRSVTDRIRDPLVMSHPVYQYLERRYGLDAVSVHLEPDIVPDDEMIALLEDLLIDHPSKWMVWEGRPMAESVELLQDLGLRSVVFDPCGNAPESGDYMDMMRRNVSELEKIVD